MFTKRIIPCLDVKNGRVVKGVNFVNLRDAGDPVEIAAAYDAAGADELVFLDITASSDARNTVVDMVRRVAETVFIPFTVGGGIRTVEDFRTLLREGRRQDLDQLRRDPESVADPVMRQTNSGASVLSLRSTPDAVRTAPAGISTATAVGLTPALMLSNGP